MSNLSGRFLCGLSQNIQTLLVMICKSSPITICRLTSGFEKCDLFRILRYVKRIGTAIKVS